VPYFAGFQLKSDWGLSSEVEVSSPSLFRDAAAKGASLLFTPTVTARDPLESSEYAYTRFKLVAEGQEGVTLLTRPLSANIGEVKALLEQKYGDSKIIFSTAVASFAEAQQLLEDVSREPDALELDVNLTCLLSGKGVTYAIELAKELSATLKSRLILKLGTASANLVNLERLADDSGAAAMVFTSNMVYKVGRHFFRLTIPSFLSAPLLVGIAESLAELDISVAYVVQSARQSGREELLELAPLKLYDATYILNWMQWKGGKKVGRVSTVPLAWKPINRKLKVYSRKEANFCPYGLIKGEGFVEGCNYCGVCFELNEPGLIELAALLSP
jgi:hypothetical protein